MRLIAGLGNPGPRYAGTRHNMGFAVIDSLSDRLRAKAAGKAHGALVGKARIDGEEALLVKPQTFMNRSGDAVRPILDAARSDPAELIVIHDDLDLPLGRIRVRKSGGGGGHNGVASIIAALGTGGFVRVRLGVGRPLDGQDPADYVLSNFSRDELETVRKTVETAVDAVISIVTEGPDKAMNRFNSLSQPNEK